MLNSGNARSPCTESAIAALHGGTGQGSNQLTTACLQLTRPPAPLIRSSTPAFRCFQGGTEELTAPPSRSLLRSMGAETVRRNVNFFGKCSDECHDCRVAKVEVRSAHWLRHLVQPFLTCHDEDGQLNGLPIPGC